MSVSKLLPASGNNDFNVSITGTYTVATFTKEYSPGAYTITSSVGDTSYDIYLINPDGSSAGYSKTAGITATQGFNKMVILGGTNGDVLGFEYKTTYTTENETAEVAAGPVIASVSPTDMPKVDDTITVTGRNFATDVAISFTNTGYSATAAKSIVRTSATSLIVTRPDIFPVATSAYTITASNPGITNPTGTNSNILATSVTAGNAPVWSTNATLPSYTKNVAYSTTLVATDADASSAITYSIVSGLPTGLTLASTSGVLSGTSTSSIPLTSIVVRATDSGGNFVDRTFTIPNTGPVWSTTGALTGASTGNAYTFTLLAPDDSGTTPTFALVSGALPTGLTLAATSGVISGTPTVGSAGTSSTFVISATDTNSVTVNSGTLSLYVASQLTTRFTSSGSFVPAVSGTITVVLAAGGGSGGRYNGSGNVGSGGGGAGGCLSQTLSVTAGTSYAYTVGAGGAAISSGTATSNGNKGTDTTFAGLTTAIGGGAGFGSQMSTNGWITSPFTGVGGSGGGGGESTFASGTAGQGNNGGSSGGQYGGGGGGGASGVGTSVSGNSSSGAGAGGAGTTLLTYALGGGGGGGRAPTGSNQDPGAGGSGGGGIGGKSTNGGNGTAFSGGGGGGADSTNNSGAGGSGAVIIQYLG
jgi:hypothetical protein